MSDSDSLIKVVDVDSGKLLRTQAKLEKLMRGKRGKKTPRKSSRKQGFAFDPGKQVVLWQGDKTEILPGAWFQPFIGRYDGGDPRFWILVFRDNSSQGKYAKIILKRIPYEIFVQFGQWFEQYKSLFTDMQTKYVIEQEERNRQKLQRQLTFASLGEIVGDRATDTDTATTVDDLIKSIL